MNCNWARVLRWVLGRIVLYVGLFYVLLCVAGCAFQESLVFIPREKIETNPSRWGMAYKEFFVGSDKIHCWWIPVKDPDAKTVLFCHGNAGNISNRLDTIRVYTEELNCNVMIFDYSGYGLSGGKVGEKATYQNARDVYSKLVDEMKIDPKKLILHGRSLGGAIASNLAVEKPCCGLILESCFTSIKDMAQTIFRSLPVGWVIRIKYRTIDNVRSVKVPVLVVHSDEDEIIPFSMGLRLYEAAPRPKRWLKIAGDHNGGWMESQKVYTEGMKDFIKAL